MALDMQNLQEEQPVARRRFQPDEVTERLREQAARQITPEQAAGELGVSHNTFLSYLTECGGQLASKRFFILPEEVCDDDDTAIPAGAGR
jgi:predicted DNA-binding protein (UPF0251 family)